MKKNLLLILLLLCGLPGFGQETEKLMDKLNRGQKKHFLLFCQIQMATKDGKADHQKVFEAYVSVIAESCKVTQPQYQKIADNLQERADKALMNGRNEIAERVGKVAKIYTDMSQSQLNIMKAYEDKNTEATHQTLSQMQALETLMNNNRLKTLERDWLFPAEAEQFLLQSLGSKK